MRSNSQLPTKKAKPEKKKVPCKPSVLGRRRRPSSGGTTRFNATPSAQWRIVLCCAPMSKVSTTPTEKAQNRTKLD